jgi:hypothetical protein
MFICDPAGFLPQSYALTSQIDYHFLQQEQHRQQQLRIHSAMLLQQMRAATNAATRVTTTRQASKQPITKEQREQNERTRK